MCQAENYYSNFLITCRSFFFDVPRLVLAGRTRISSNSAPCRRLVLISSFSCKKHPKKNLSSSTTTFRVCKDQERNVLEEIIQIFVRFVSRNRRERARVNRKFYNKFFVVSKSCRFSSVSSRKNCPTCETVN